MNESFALMGAVGSLFWFGVCFWFLHIHGNQRLGWMLRLGMGGCAICAAILFGTQLSVATDIARLSPEFGKTVRALGPWATALALAGLWRYKLKSTQAA